VAEDPKNPDAKTGIVFDDEADIMTSTTAFIPDSERPDSKADDGASNVIVQAGLSEERVTFSNLQALVPERPTQEAMEPVVRRPVSDVPSIVFVTPPSLRKFALSGLLIILIGIGLWVGWRLDWKWNQLIQDPVNSIEIVLGIRPMPILRIEPPPQKVVINNLKGHLRIESMRTELIQENGKYSLKVVGKLNNRSNRVHHAIILKVKLVDEQGIPVMSRRLTCCQSISPDGGILLVDHVNVGQSTDFVTVFTSAKPFPPKLRPRVSIVFSEVKPPQ
jgi:hypothetical protein